MNPPREQQSQAQDTGEFLAVLIEPRWLGGCSMCCVAPVRLSCRGSFAWLEILATDQECPCPRSIMPREITEFHHRLGNYIPAEGRSVLPTTREISRSRSIVALFFAPFWRPPMRSPGVRP
jgi:hypothetical protein